MIQEFRNLLTGDPRTLVREALGLAGLVVTILAAFYLPVLA